jgi:hypothetical protein
MPRPAPHSFADWIVKLLNERGPLEWWTIHRAYEQTGFVSNFSTFPKRLAHRVRMGKIACAMHRGHNWYFDPAPLVEAGFDLTNVTDRAIAADWLEEHGCTTTLPTILRTCTRFTFGVAR